MHHPKQTKPQDWTWGCPFPLNTWNTFISGNYSSSSMSRLLPVSIRLSGAISQLTELLSRAWPATSHPLILFVLECLSVFTIIRTTRMTLKETWVTERHRSPRGGTHRYKIWMQFIAREVTSLTTWTVFVILHFPSVHQICLSSPDLWSTDTPSSSHCHIHVTMLQPLPTAIHRPAHRETYCVKSSAWRPSLSHKPQRTKPFPRAFSQPHLNNWLAASNQKHMMLNAFFHSAPNIVQSLIHWKTCYRPRRERQFTKTMLFMSQHACL